MGKYLNFYNSPIQEMNEQSEEIKRDKAKSRNHETFNKKPF